MPGFFSAVKFAIPTTISFAMLRLISVVQHVLPFDLNILTGTSMRAVFRKGSK